LATPIHGNEEQGRGTGVSRHLVDTQGNSESQRIAFEYLWDI
jgi:hypothetical protein